MGFAELIPSCGGRARSLWERFQPRSLVAPSLIANEVASTWHGTCTRLGWTSLFTSTIRVAVGPDGGAVKRGPPYARQGLPTLFVGAAPIAKRFANELALIQHDVGSRVGWTSLFTSTNGVAGGSDGGPVKRGPPYVRPGPPTLFVGAVSTAKGKSAEADRQRISPTGHCICRGECIRQGARSAPYAFAAYPRCALRNSENSSDCDLIPSLA